MRSALWIVLPNAAPAGSGKFHVTDLALRDALDRAQHLGSLRGIDLSSERRFLWHSHYVADQPSNFDVEEFPGWLVTHGAVWHARSGRTTLYNATGIISDTAPVEGANATKDIS